MITIGLDEAIVALVGGMLPRGSDDKKFLCISLCVSGSKLPVQLNTKTIRRYIYMLFHRPSNYTKVLWGKSNDPKSRLIDITEWKVLSDHASCWQNDGVRSPLWNLQEEIRAEFDSPKVLSKDCEVRAGFDNFNPPKIVVVKDFVYNREKRRMSISW